MTALDLTADAEEYREIAFEFTADVTIRTLLHDYAERGVVAPGLCNQIRQRIAGLESDHRVRPRAGNFGRNYRLHKLLTHLAPLEDQLDPDKACPESPTGWHEWANNEQCCHCGKDVP